MQRDIKYSQSRNTRDAHASISRDGIARRYATSVDRWLIRREIFSRGTRSPSLPSFPLFLFFLENVNVALEGSRSVPERYQRGCGAANDSALIRGRECAGARSLSLSLA
jgi:hypothetical protein